MTILDMHNAVNLELDKTQDYSFAYMQPEQIDYWLNKAITRLVKTKYSGNNLARTGFEQTQKRTDDLRLVTKFTADGSGNPSIQSVSLLPDNLTYTYTLPSDYWFLVRLDIQTQVGNCAPELNPGSQVRQDTVSTIQEDPFNRSYNQIPTYYIVGNKIYFPTDGSFTILGVIPYYVRQPTTVALGSQYVSQGVDVNCDLSVELHDEIIDSTVSMILENIESPRVQTQPALSRSENE